VTVQPQDAIRAWLRLEAAFAAFNAELLARHGLTGAQLGMLRLIAEFGGRTSLTELRERLALHPATLGQLVARLAEKGLVSVSVDRSDQRRRLVQLNEQGERLLAEAPLAGPVRLRQEPPDPVTLAKLTEAFELALDAFGLTQHAPKGRIHR
jgi:MarR family transcriptional regulator, temperature-dependent positive regulator of motility